MKNREPISRLTKAAVAGGALLLLAAGCAATPQAAPDAGSPSPSATSVTATPSQSMQPSQAQYPAADPYGEMLVIPVRGAVKAGESMPVTGGTLPPGTTVTVYGAQLMAMPSYDAANDMYHQVGEQILITDRVTAVTNAEGGYELNLPFPAGTPAQQVDIIVESSAPSNTGATGSLLRAAVE